MFTRLEPYLKRTISDLAGVLPGESANWSYQLRIRDKYRFRTPETIENWKHFPNKTRGVAVECGVRGSRNMTVILTFDRWKSFTKMRVDYDGSSSLERVEGLIKGILNEIEDYRAYRDVLHHWIFHLWVAVLFLVNGVLLTNSIYHHRPQRQALFLTGLVCSVVAGMFWFLKPYTAFDTPWQSRIQRGINWIGGTLLGLFAGTIYALVQLKIIGW